MREELIKLVKALSESKEESQPVRIIHKEEAEQKFWAVVLEPMSTTGPGGVGDAHGHVMTKEEIQKSAHNFMLNGGQIFKDHKGALSAKVFECFCAPCEFKIGEEIIKDGTWVLGTKVYDAEMWRAIESGEYEYYSPGGYGVIVEN